MISHSFDIVFVTLTAVVMFKVFKSTGKFCQPPIVTKTKKIAGVVNSADKDIAKADCYVGFTILVMI